MKFSVFILLIIYLLPSTTMFSQKDHFKNDTSSGKFLLVSLIGENDGHFFTYDQKGKILKYVAKVFSVVGTVNTTESYTYDENERLLTVVYHFGEGDSELKINRKASYSYDKAGNRIYQILEYLHDDGWEFWEKISFEYDIKKNIVSELVEKWSDSGWVSESKTNFSYDNNGNKLSEMEKIWSSSGEDSYRSVFVYNQDGKMVSENRDIWSENKWKTDWTTTYNYNNKGELQSSLSLNIVDDSLYYGSRLTYTYDDYGNKLSELQESYTDGSWKNYRKNTFINDLAGNIVSATENIWKDNAWMECTKREFTYDSNCNTLTGKNLSTCEFPGNPNLTFYYNNAQDKMSIHSSQGVATYIYIHGLNKIFK